MTTAPLRVATRSRGPVRVVAAGTALALVLVLAVYALAHLAGDELVVTPAGRPAGRVPVTAAVGATVVAGLLTVPLALVVGWLARPRMWFLAVTSTALAVSFVPPFGASPRTSTALWLCAMHLAVAAAVVPTTLRSLPAGAR